MTLLNGEILWNLIWVLPLLLILFYYSRHKRMTLLRRFLGERAVDPKYVNASHVLRFWRGVLFMAVMVLLLVAAARPSWGESILPYSGQGRDLMVVFDVSRSMLAQDVRPSRLEHAKWLVRQLTEKNSGDRFGLIAFAGNAFLECPLTIDRTSFLQSVDELNTDSIPLGGTNIERALSEAVRGFTAAESSFRAVVLITDGDELTGDSGKALAEIIRLRVPLFILGIGDPAQPSIVQVPDENGGVHTLRDRQGNVVSVPLNEKKLAELARQTGGIYVRSTTTHPGLDRIEAGIRKLETREIDSGKQTRPIERPLYPLLAALALFCLWLLLGERRLRTERVNTSMRVLIFAGFFLFALPGQAQNAAPETESKAENKTETAVPAGLTPEELYNRGLKAQTQENAPKKAVKLYEQAIAAAHAAPEVRSRSAQNLGVMNHQLARSMFQQAQNRLRSQQLDQALQQTRSTLQQLASAEEIYRESLRDGQEPSSVARNQSLLIQDRQKAEELKKKIEELKKKQQEARQNTQQAKDQQNQQNQKNQQDKNNQNQQQNQQNQKNQHDKNKQSQQDQQDQKNQQDQNKQSQQDKNNQQGQQEQQQNKQGQQDKNKQSQQQNSASQQTDKAREDARQLEQQAKELDQKNLEEQARQAGQELDRAREAQKQNDGKKAEEHLKKALEQLNSGAENDRNKDQSKDKDEDKKQDKDKSGQDKKEDQQGKDQNKSGEPSDSKEQPDKELPKPGEARPAEKSNEPEKEIDKGQAAALLDLMADDEKKLKDELKERMKRSYGTRPVEKDW